MLMSVPNTDISALWSLSPEDFNSWRKKNDLPLLFGFFQEKLPKFNDWLEEFGIGQEAFINAPNTGVWFAGSEKCIFEKFSENDRPRYGIYPERNVRKTDEIHKRFPDLKFDLLESTTFLPYLTWARKITGNDRFILSDRNNKTYTDTLSYGLWSSVDLPKHSRASLLKDFQVLKLGGVRIGPHVPIGGRNLDFADIDHLVVLGGRHGSYATHIYYSSCRNIQIESAEISFFTFYESDVEELTVKDSRIQDFTFSRCKTRRPTLINTTINGLSFENTVVLQPILEKCEITRFQYAPFLENNAYGREADNCRRFRSAFQSIGENEQARAFHYLERCFARKESYTPLKKHRGEFPRQKFAGSLQDLNQALRSKQVDNKKGLGFLVDKIIVYLRVLFTPKYAIRYLRYKLSYLMSLVEFALWGYGERPSRIVANSILIIVLFASVFYTKGPPGAYQSLIGSLYFSVVTFTTLGYGDIKPAGDILRIMCGTEALLGALMMGLIIAGFARRSAY